MVRRGTAVRSSMDSVFSSIAYCPLPYWDI
ncbi:hypothetical protein BH24CHL4_BH24CHL4_21040 [soil metagenome]